MQGTITSSSSPSSSPLLTTDREVASLLQCEIGEIKATVSSRLMALLPSHAVSMPSKSWRLEVATSSVKDDAAGDGIFLRGNCDAGSVLCCYGPSIVFQLDDLPVMHQLVLPNNGYVVARRDGILLDARPDGPSAQLREVARLRDAAASRGSTPSSEARCALNIGHKVNHPPLGTLANVILVPLDLHADEYTELQAFIEAHHFRPPAPSEPTKQTVVFVAKRRIEDGEELFLDYKLRADGPGFESWYHPPVDTSATGM